MQVPEQRLLVDVQLEPAHGLRRVELLAHPFQQIARLHGLLVRRLRRLDGLLQRALDAVQIREREFGVDHLDVVRRIYLAGDMDDVVVFETAHHVRDGIHFANVRQEFIAETLPGGSAGDEARDVDELHGGGQDAFRMDDGRQLLQTRIGYRHHPHVRIDGAERIVFGRDLRPRQGIEQRGFAHVRQPDDSTTNWHLEFPCAAVQLRHRPLRALFEQ